MRKNFGAQTYLYPMPVLLIATYNDDSSADVMNAAWGGICERNTIAICIDNGHRTYANILARKAFTVSIPGEENVVAADYVGLVSANNEPDKMKKSGFTVEKAEFVDAPIISQVPMTLECKLVKVTDDGLVIGHIVNVSADEKILTDGKIDPSKFSPITFDSVNNAYIKLGEKVGNAFSDGRKLR